MKILKSIFLFVLGLQVSGQELYNYDEIWNGKSEAISATENNFNFDVYTEVYNTKVSPFTDPNWQHFSFNTLQVQENNISSFADWGGVDPNMYRNLVHYEGRERAEADDPNTTNMLVVNSTMTVAEIQAVVDAALPKTTILFEAGRYDFDAALWINKDDITLKGEVDQGGNPLVVIDMFDIANITGGVATAFDIRKPGISTIYAENSSSDGRPILITNTSGKVSAEDKTVILEASNISVMKPGDFIVFSYEEDPFFNERSISSLERLRSVAEIASVNTEASQVTLKSAVGMDYDPTRPTSKNRVSVVEKADVVSDVIISNFIFESFTEADFNTFVDPHDLTNSRPDFTDGNSAISIKTGHEIDILNITVRNAASTGISINGGFEIFIDNYFFDGAMNNGAGGNGYGILLADTHYSNITNFRISSIKPVRHAFVFAFYTTSSYNNVHMTYSNSNGDFHGGADYGNIIYFEEIDIREMDTSYPPIFDYRYEWHPRNFRTYTPPPLNQIQNTVLMTQVSAQKEGNIEGYDGFDNPNDNIDDNRSDRNDGNASSNNQTVFASANGSTINTWGNDDTIVSGVGDDVLDGGDSQDFYVFFSNSGRDTLKSFINAKGIQNTLAMTREEIGYSFRTERDSNGELSSQGDKLVIKQNVNNTDISAAEELISRVSQVGNHVIIDLGNENNIVIEDFDASNISVEDFVVLRFSDPSFVLEIDTPDDELIVYPNPANEYLILQSPKQIGTVLIYNSQGKLILKQHINSKKGNVNIIDLAKGLYLIKTENGQVKEFMR